MLQPWTFQSPRSGHFHLDLYDLFRDRLVGIRFNPLDRGISIWTCYGWESWPYCTQCFNPLDRGISIWTVSLPEEASRS